MTLLNHSKCLLATGGIPGILGQGNRGQLCSPPREDRTPQSSPLQRSRPCQSPCPHRVSMTSKPTLCFLYWKTLRVVSEPRRAKESRTETLEVGSHFPQVVGTRCTSSTKALLPVQLVYKTIQLTCQAASLRAGAPLLLPRIPVPGPRCSVPTVDLQTPKALTSLSLLKRHLAVCVCVRAHTSVTACEVNGQQPHPVSGRFCYTP